MKYRRLGSVVAACTTITLACAANAHAASPATTLATGCTSGFTVSAHHRYAVRVFHRTHISRQSTRRLTKMRRCQVQGRKATHATRRTELRLKRWRTRFHCTQSKVVNCIRDATRRYGGSFAHNLACARSESGLRPYARNGSGASGLFQFMPSTWSRTLARMGVGAKSIYSAKWQARAAAWKFRHDGFGEWSGAGC